MQHQRQTNTGLALNGANGSKLRRASNHARQVAGRARRTRATVELSAPLPAAAFTGIINVAKIPTVFHARHLRRISANG